MDCDHLAVVQEDLTIVGLVAAAVVVAAVAVVEPPVRDIAAVVQQLFEKMEEVIAGWIDGLDYFLID